MAKLASDLRSEMAALGAALRAEMHQGLSSLARQMYLAVLGQTVVMLGFVYFFATQLR